PSKAGECSCTPTRHPPNKITIGRQRSPYDRRERSRLANETSSFDSSLRPNSTSSTGASTVFPGTLITRRPSREAAATRNILTSSTRFPATPRTLVATSPTARSERQDVSLLKRNPVATWVLRTVRDADT